MPAYRFRKSHLAASAALAIALLAGLFATQAGAAAYKARFCAEGPPAQGGDKGPFARSGNETVFELSEACGNFNGLRISHRTGEAGAEGVFGRWLAERPEGVTVTGISYRAQGERSAGYFPQVIGTQPGGAVGIINGDQELDGAFKDFTVSGDVRRFGIQLICQTGGGGCAASPPGQPEAGLKSVDYSLDDPSAPSVVVTGGTLFEGAAQLGKQTIRFDAGDAGSGVRRVIAVVNGEDAASAGAGCNSGGGVAFGFTPCPAAFSELLSVDTAAAPWRVGRNSVKVCAEDFAGTRQCTGASRVLALNGCATNAAAAETMELEWPGKRGVVQSRQGRARSAIARVLGAGRAPIAGGSVCFSRAIPGAGDGVERVLEGAALTDAAGARKGEGPRAVESLGPGDLLRRFGIGDHRADPAQGLARDPTRAALEQAGRGRRQDPGGGDAARQVAGRPQGLLLRLAARARQVRLRHQRQGRPGAGRLPSPRRAVRCASTPRCRTSATIPTSGGARTPSACA